MIRKGIVLSDNPYILVIYTKELESADEKISEISRILYNLVSNSNK